MTGAGMMDCKAALTETNGDMEAAVDWLRQGHFQGRQEGRPYRRRGPDRRRCRAARGGRRRGQFRDRLRRPQRCLPGDRAQRRQGRAAHSAATRGRVAAQISGHPTSPSPTRSRTRSARSARTCTLPPFGEAVGVAGLGRDLCPQRRRRQSRQARRAGRHRDDGRCAQGAHAFARQVAMHVAATNPLSLDSDALDPAASNARRRSSADQARQSGKPENIIEKMVEGPSAQVLRGSRASEAGLRAQPRRDRREGAEGCREGDRRAGEDHRLSSASRSAKASRRKSPTSRPRVAAAVKK